jgi:hypothetical protein
MQAFFNVFSLHIGKMICMIMSRTGSFASAVAPTLESANMAA